MKMNRKYALGVTAIVTVTVLLLAATAFGAWYYTPRTFLSGIDASEVERISVFDGSTGKRFYIDDDSDIKAVVENIQSIEMTRGKISSNYDGFSFSMSFLDAEGETIDSFIVNGLNTIRDDPFFYHTGEGVLCYEHLRALEDEYFAEDGQ